MTRRTPIGGELCRPCSQLACKRNGNPRRDRVGMSFRQDRPAHKLKLKPQGSPASISTRKPSILRARSVEAPWNPVSGTRPRVTDDILANLLEFVAMRQTAPTEVASTALRTLDFRNGSSVNTRSGFSSFAS
jgi:hypothetical protein